MVNWFGPASWGAPICRECPRCEIPVGTLCLRCARRIRTRDHGVTMPYLGGAHTVAAFHLDCHLKTILPHSRWAQNNLTPDDSDGVVHGRFVCFECKVAWTADGGWSTLDSP